MAALHNANSEIKQTCRLVFAATFYRLIQQRTNTRCDSRA